MKTTLKILYWSPRILCILAILFVSMFALDSFESGHTIWQQIGAFLIHLIPSFILIVMLVVAWKWELIGGIIIAATGILFTPFIFIHNFQMNNSVWMSVGIIMAITFPFIIVGVLFLLSHFLRLKETKKQNLTTN
ncbi:MAG: hypothetical protein HQ542_00860 [Bacteroidia bacterium]|nr:hypothetical protein [Bacteroidia bacterium]